MSIHAADALMEIFGFKRVADDEITLDNPPSLDDDGGLLNEGMKMSEVKNEGLEVGGVRAIVTDAFVSMIEAALGMKAPDCAPPAFIQSAIDRAIDRINSESLAGYTVRDSRIAELEGMVICCGVAATNADPLLTTTGAYAEKFASQQSSDVLALRLERDQLRAELAAIKAQDPVEWEVYYSDDDSFHTITLDKSLIECYSKMAYTIKPLYAAPVATPAPIPDADHSEDVRAMVVPEGYKLVPIEPTAAQCFTAAFNLCNEFGEEFVRDNKQFAMATYRWLVAASQSAKGGE